MALNLDAFNISVTTSGQLAIGDGATSLRIGPALRPSPPAATSKTAVAAWCGSCALDSSGTVTVTTTAVTATSLILCWAITAGGTVGGLYRVAAADVTAGTSFIIRSFVSSTAGAVTAATTDTSTVGWLILG